MACWKCNQDGGVGPICTQCGAPSETNFNKTDYDKIVKRKDSFFYEDIDRFKLAVDARKLQQWAGAAEFDAIGEGDIHTSDFGAGLYVTLYRCMTFREYYGLRVTGVMMQSSGHHGLAPNRGYCLHYYKHDYTHIVEFMFPSNFIKEMYEEGWYEGSVEDGALAWGLGKQHKNSWAKGPKLKALKVRPATKKTARSPYDIYLNWLHAIRWKVVNARLG